MPSTRERIVLGDLLLEAELCRVTAAIDSRGIGSAVLKGVPLARRLSGGVAGRGLLADNDVLVRRRDASRAADAVGEIGYRPVGRYSLDALLPTAQALPMVRQSAGGVPVWLDLHWAPFPPRLYPIDEDLIWAHLEPFSVGGTSINIPDRTLTLIQLASHYAQHGLAVPGILSDLAQAWNCWHDKIDLEELRQLAQVTDLVHALDYGLGVAHRRRLLAVDRPVLGSVRAARLARVLPEGRPAAIGPDYLGVGLAATLAGPQRLSRWFVRAAVPQPSVLAAKVDKSVTPRLAVDYVRRLSRAARQLTSASGGTGLRR